MNIFTYLKQDHRKVSNLLSDVVDAEEMPLRLEIFSEIYKELTLHAESEQKTFYKAINKTKKSEEEVDHAKDEHKEIKDLLKQLKNSKVSESEWLITFGELKSMVEHHVKEEEDDIFPLAKKILSATQTQTLVEDMEMEKERIAIR